MNIHLDDLVAIQDAAADVIGYLTDTSCSDPECCGGPYYTIEDFGEGVSILSKYGLKVDE